MTTWTGQWHSAYSNRSPAALARTTAASGCDKHAKHAPAHWPHANATAPARHASNAAPPNAPPRSEEHTSELQSLMRISYAVFCLKKKKNNITDISRHKNNNTPTKPT